MPSNLNKDSGVVFFIASRRANKYQQITETHRGTLFFFSSTSMEQEALFDLVPIVKFDPSIRGDKNPDNFFKGVTDLRRTYLENIVSHATIPGVFAEFGVWKGTTAKMIHQFAPERDLYLFDSFEGLPEDWFGNFKRGVFALPAGQVPQFPQSDRVHVCKGWFDDTVPKFAQELENKGQHIAFLNIDSDLYSSARCILFGLNDSIKVGTVISFDELFGYDKWLDHEWRALHEWTKECDRKWKFLGRTDYMQAAIIVTK